MAAEIRLNDFGTVFEFTITDGVLGTPIDLSQVSNITLTLVPPSKVSKDRTASVYGDPTDGVCRYTTIAGDIDEIGKWQSQLDVTFQIGRVSCGERVESWECAWGVD